MEETVRKMNDFKKSEKSSISIDQIKNYIFGREESFSNWEDSQADKSKW